jgi:hypothetical protein
MHNLGGFSGRFRVVQIEEAHSSQMQPFDGAQGQAAWSADFMRLIQAKAGGRAQEQKQGQRQRTGVSAPHEQLSTRAFYPPSCHFSRRGEKWQTVKV